MTKWRVTYGDPTDPVVTHLDGDEIHLGPMDPEGCRNLKVYEDGEDGVRETAEITVGPSHILGYQKAPQ